MASYQRVLPRKNTITPRGITRSRRGFGSPLPRMAISRIGERHLGTSRVHALRHTVARAMEDAGAPVAEIQARLGHRSLATTSRYRVALRREPPRRGAGGLARPRCVVTIVRR